MFPFRKRPEAVPDPADLDLPPTTQAAVAELSTPEYSHTTKYLVDSLRSNYGTYWRNVFRANVPFVGLVLQDGTMLWSFECATPTHLRTVSDIPLYQPATSFTYNQSVEIIADGTELGHADNARELAELWYRSGVSRDTPLRILAEHPRFGGAAETQGLFDFEQATFVDFGRMFNLEHQGY